MLWEPVKHWEGQDAFLIGGGASLRRFNFKLLAGLNTIGINDAFRLGEDVVKYCMFGDASWWHKNCHKLSSFKNPVVTCASSLLNLNSDKLLCLRRKSSGLHEGNQCGWNFCTGAAAINFAINLGAHRIFLLGFDMREQDGRTHWHDLRGIKTREAVFERFLRGFQCVNDHLKLFPNVEVIHVIDGESRLPFFRRMETVMFYKFLDFKKRELECQAA